MPGAVATLQLLGNSLERRKEAFAASPEAKREIAYFIDNVGKVRSSAGLVENYRLFAFAMKAFGLEDMTYAKALMRRVMDGGLKDPDSAANRLADVRFRAFAKAFNFGDLGARATASKDANAKVVASYIDNSFERQVGRDNSGAQLALYFQRKAPGITSNLQILADKALAEFTRTAFNLPSSSGSTIEADLAMLDRVLKVEDLKSPAKVDRLVLRFAAMWDAKYQPISTSSASSAALAALSPGGISSSAALLGRIQGQYLKS